LVVQFARQNKFQGRLIIRLGLGMLALALVAQPLPVIGQALDPTPLVHTVKAGDNLIKICSQYRDRTNHYSLTDLMNAIRRTNDLQSNLLQIGQKLEIPVLPEGDYPVVSRKVADGAEMRGIYLTGPACGVSTVWQRVDGFVESGGNAVVFDAKDIDGGISFHSQHPLAGWGKGRPAPVISSLPDMMDRMEKRGLYVVARLALFLDGELGRQRPDLALPDAEGNPWTERGCAWIDASQPEVRDYNLTLALELAVAGVDEIQFDYVRFPTNGWREDWDSTEEPDLETEAARRREIITAFLSAAHDTLGHLGVKISADLYGIMAWGRMEDLALTGQHVPTIASVVDIICPMIYPSHFNPGFEGRRRPGDDPEYFIGEGTRRFVELAAGQAEIRPWLQAFPYRVSNYDGQYIAAQIESSRSAGGSGWCLWNPACRYQTALTVLPGLCDDPLPLPALPTGEPISMLARVSDVEPAAGPAAESAADPLPEPVPLRDSPATMLGAMVDPKGPLSPAPSPNPGTRR
jgi:hypothetical protein